MKKTIVKKHETKNREYYTSHQYVYFLGIRLWESGYIGYWWDFGDGTCSPFEFSTFEDAIRTTEELREERHEVKEYTI